MQVTLTRFNSKWFAQPITIYNMKSGCQQCHYYAIFQDVSGCGFTTVILVDTQFNTCYMLDKIVNHNKNHKQIPANQG